MAQQNLNLGTTPNDGTGDTLRCAFCKTETNFTDVYSCISGIDTSISNINSCLVELDNQIDTPELFSWGFNNVGQLGTNNLTCYSVPTQEHCAGDTWCKVSAGVCHTLSIKTDGTLWGWGRNGYGELGLNTSGFSDRKSSPTQEVCGGTNWCTVSAGFYHSSAIKTDGTLWRWGINQYGQLGTNNFISRSTPTQEHCGGTNWCMVSSGDFHNFSIKKDGTLWGSGRNFRGELGTNDTICYSTPTQEHCGGTNWCMVSAGGCHTSALKTDGTLWGWGYNFYGQLGTNVIDLHSTPTQEHCGGTNWCMVSSGYSHTLAIKTNGTIWGWGRNSSGRLGTNNTICYSTPQQEVCGGTNWCMVSTGDVHTSSIKTDGTLWSWGSGGDGRLGTNNTITQSTPTQEACGFTDWSMVSAGGFHTSAIRID